MNKTKPTIYFFLYNTKHNGGNKVVCEYANRLSKRGYTVKLVVLFGKNFSWIPIDVPVISIFSLFFEYPDILIATFWPTAYITFLLRAKKKMYFIQAWEEEFSRNYFLKKLALFSIKLPLNKIVTSHFLKKKVSLYTKSTVLEVFPYGIDGTIFKPALSRKKTSVIRILTVMSFYKIYKGPDIYDLAVKELKKIHPEYVFILASNEKFPCAPVNEFYSNPSTNQLVKLYQTSDILLVPSRSEGFFIPGLEAMASKCLVITTDNGGIHEYAAHNKNAIILKSIEELWKNNVIKKLLANKKLVLKLQEEGIKTAQKYTWGKSISSLERSIEITF